MSAGLQALVTIPENMEKQELLNEVSVTTLETGDPYQPFLWLAMIPGSLLAAGWIRSQM